MLKHEHSDDGTRKWLLDVGANQAVETVYIPEPNRGTLCISSQAGLRARLRVLRDGLSGLQPQSHVGRDPGAGRARGARARADAKITNVVFMGMGEPLANYRNVLPVVHLLIDDQAFGLSRRRVTISTAGVVPQMLKLANDCNVALAVSLHAPTDELRDKLVPINKIHPIAELLDACWKYAEGQASRSITFEYVLLDGVNDSVAQARQLVQVAAQPAGQGESDSVQRLSRSRSSAARRSRRSTRSGRRCATAGLIATIRRPRGDDIAAACGQLAGRVRDRQRVRLGDRVIGASSS